MALIACPECGHHVSDMAVSCPKCGFPVASVTDVTALDDGLEALDAGVDKLVENVKESWNPNVRTESIATLYVTLVLLAICILGGGFLVVVGIQLALPAIVVGPGILLVWFSVAFATNLRKVRAIRSNKNKPSGD